MKSEQARAAAAIRKQLKVYGIAATVKSRSASMMTAVDVTLFDATPGTVKRVEEFCGQFKYGHFDGMTDCYEYSNRRDDLPQVKFLDVRVRFSDELKGRATEFAEHHFADFNDVSEFDRAARLRDVLLGTEGRFWSQQKPRVSVPAVAA